MKLLTFSKLIVPALVLCLSANHSYAQEKQQQSKSEDASQKVIVKKIDGKEGKQEIKVIVNTDDVDINVEQNVQVEVQEIDGEKHIKVEVKPLDGETEIIEWTGEGDLPEDMRQKLESKGIYLHEVNPDAEKGVFIYKDGGEDASFNWVSDDMPGAFLGVVSAVEAKMTVIVDEDGKEQITESPASDENGLVVGEVVEGSAAEEAGLKKGDILRKIDNTTLEDFSDLVEYMQDTEVGQQVTIAYERNGQVTEAKTTLTERKGGYGNVIIEKIADGKELDKDGNVFFFRTEDDLKVHQKHRIVVITRGGEDTSKDVIEVSPETLPDTELQRTLSLRDYNLYPNPTDGNLRLRFSGEAVPTKIEINDMNGKNMYRERLNRFSGQYDENIDLSDLPSGVFLLTIRQNDKVYTEQIVVK
ncbi:MAG: PDZ domain-containing protein [Saprospiraceae bacterium]